MNNIIIIDLHKNWLSEIIAGINEDKRFIDGVVLVCTNFLGRKLTPQTMQEVNGALTEYTRAYFIKFDYINPGWIAKCQQDQKNDSNVIIFFEDRIGSLLTAEQLQNEIDKG